MFDRVAGIGLKKRGLGRGRRAHGMSTTLESQRGVAALEQHVAGYGAEKGSGSAGGIGHVGPPDSHNAGPTT